VEAANDPAGGGRIFFHFSHRRARQETAQKAGDVAPLPLVLPAPTLKGTPQNLPTNTSAPPFTDKPPRRFMRPKESRMSRWESR
jgi:hypothetical protein